MRFEEWYEKTVGVTLAKAVAIGTFDLQLMQKAWEGSREDMKEEAAQLMEIQSPHLFMDPDGMAEKIRALK